MKKNRLLFSGLVLCASLILVGTIILTSTNSKERDQFEDFLIQSAQDYPGNLDGEEGKKVGFDSPDIAAYADFRKTVDPVLKRVPAERLRTAYFESNALQRMKSSNGLDWDSHPSDMGGRTRTVFFDPNDGEGKRVFAGAVTGGLWINNDPFSDQAWEPVNDFWPNLSVSCMTADPINPQSMYIGTGESQTALIIYRESSTVGMGIMHSADGGTTWEVLPSTSDWAYVTDIVIRNEGGQSVIYAGVVSGLYKGTLHESKPEDGLYRSSDMGESWTQVLPLLPDGDRAYSPADIEVSADGERLFVGTTYHGEDRRGAACLLYSDNGLDWTVNTDYYDAFTSGLDIQNSQRTFTYPGRVVLATAPGNSDVVYALIAGGYMRGDAFVGYDCALILKSEDKGQTWIDHPNVPMRDQVNTFAYLAWHALAAEVDPTDSNTLWIGGLDVWRSNDSGDTWQQMSYWAPGGEEQAARYVHADIHSFAFRPDSPTEMMIGTDGGVFYSGSANAASPTFQEKNIQYSTLQFYSCALHPEPGERYFMGGLQDNGTLLYIGDQVPNNGFRISGGDGAFCFIDQNEPNIQYTTIYYTWVNVYDIVPDDHFNGITANNFNFGTFINPMDYDYQYNTLYANGVHFTGYNANKIGVVRLVGSRLSGGLKDVPTDSDVPFSAIKWFEESGENASTIYMGTESGRLFRLEDAVLIGDLTELTGDEFPAGNISSIDIGHSEDTVLVSFSNYGIPSVWLTTDHGDTWTDIEANLPDMPVRWAIFHPENSRQIMLATETGIWTCENATAQNVVWSPDISGMANVRTDMLKVRPADNMVLAATHGRGMYTTIWNPIHTSGISDFELIENLSVYPNPTDGRFDIEVSVKQETELRITDMSGKLIVVESISPQNGLVKRSFDLRDQAKGIYFVQAGSGSDVQIRRLIIQ
ncbi:MAG: T9SS type A sorting domain-containing protein [Bacteroidetes bacterium]|jgi:hypothetical protein|nr:T9SS type A sorting domain-containing protein [Bacteroidota bacterium]MBT7093606.1 T9SS type A sorting domain-containing protein [Bacteroidota bacterium]MBT7465539.1 T9SS type A sorting domain-containing protein [Bacteroidota bacterium]